MPAISPNLVRTISSRGDPTFQPVADIRSLVQKIRGMHPQGAHTILIGRSSANTFKSVRAPNGIIAILIGLLLPAVQKATSANSSDLALLQSVLKPGGTLGFVMADGSVREAHSGRTVSDCEGYAYLSSNLLGQVDARP